MSIILYGPPWVTVQRLRERLATVPETGTFTLGGRPKNSIEQLTAFREAGLETPDFTTDRQTAMDWVNTGTMVFGRRLIHTRGNDIVISPKGQWYLKEPDYQGSITKTRWWNSEWWSRYIPPTDEWRVHVFDGKVIARGKKVHSGASWRKAPVRNVGNGWTFIFTENPPKGLRTAARKACDSLRYESGAVDIIVGEGGKFYILEVNRCPAMTCEYTLGAWERAIRGHVGGTV